MVAFSAPPISIAGFRRLVARPALALPTAVRTSGQLNDRAGAGRRADGLDAAIPLVRRGHVYLRRRRSHRAAAAGGRPPRALFFLFYPEIVQHFIIYLAWCIVSHHHKKSVVVFPVTAAYE